MPEPTKTCPNCKKDIPVDAVVCIHCQGVLSDVPAAGAAPPVDRTFLLPEIRKIIGGRYELLNELGRGGMGIVYKAHDTRLGIDVAIKLLPEHLARDARSVEYMRREALASMRLGHPNILRLHNFEDHADGKFLIMEFIDGKTLYQVLEESSNHKLPEKDVTKYVIEACRGLEYAHSEGVIHRDIKPSNIMLDSRGRVKIADFGIARVLKDSFTRQTGRVTSGTLLYMSPEQILGQKCDARSDIYSLGITIYELLHGEPPFVTGDISIQHREIIPPPIKGISDRFNAIILRCVEKKPEDRFQSAGELMEALEGKVTFPLAKTEEAGSEKPALLSPPPRKARLAPAVLAIMIFIALWIGGYVLFQENALSPPASVLGDKTGAKTKKPAVSVPPAFEKPGDTTATETPEILSKEMDPAQTIDPQEVVNAQEIPEGMVLVPAGEFLMGSPNGEGEDDENPQHRVYLDAFYMDKYEVTNEQYKKFCDSTGRPYPKDPDFGGSYSNYFTSCPNHPVVNVNWNDATAYAQWVGKRLPTEAEWEKAGRGGLEGKRYLWGDELPPRHKVGNFADETAKRKYRRWTIVDGYDDGYAVTAPVGKYVCNRYGVFDMSGNVWEWCSDWYDKYYYSGSPPTNPSGPMDGQFRFIRGGSWRYGAVHLRSSDRLFHSPSRAHFTIGFRCAKYSN